MDILKTKMFQPLDSCIYYVNIPFDSFVEYLTRYIESCQRYPSDCLRESGIGTYSRWKELLISWQHQNVVIQETANAEWVAIVDPYIDTSMAYFPQNNSDEPYEIFIGSSPEMCDYILQENLLEKQELAQQFSIKACTVELEDPRFPSFGEARPTYLACSWGSSAILGEQSPENRYYSHNFRRSLWAASTLGSQGLTRFSVNSWPGEIEEGRKKNPNFMELDWSEWGPDPTFRPDPDRPVYEWFNHKVVDRWGKNLGLDVFNPDFYMGRQIVFKARDPRQMVPSNEDFRPFEERQKMMGFSPEHMQWLVDQGLY